MPQHDQIKMAKEHYNDWNKESNNQYCHNCLRKLYENYQNKNCEIKKQMKRGTINDEIDPQSLGTK